MFYSLLFLLLGVSECHFNLDFAIRQMEKEWEWLQWLSVTSSSQHTTSRTLTTQMITGESNTVQVDCNVSLEQFKFKFTIIVFC